MGLLIGGCAATPAAHQQHQSVSQTNVAVDTPALRAAKKAAGVQQCRPGTATPPATKALPNVTLPCLGGGPDVDLEKLRGPLVVNLFAQWCGPCRSELPYYQQLHERARGRLSVLGVDYLDTQPGRALALVRQTGVTYPLLADPAGDLRGAFGTVVRGLPGIVLVDRQGHVVDMQLTVVRSYAQLRRLVRDHLGIRV